jgi:ATP-dependent RNA helicase DDX19/DBP5
MSEPSAGTGSLADRISKPDTMNPDAASFQPKSGTSWADEVASPTTEEVPSTSSLDASQNAVPPAQASPVPQVDGATEPFGGSQLQEPDYAVEVKLADMQADPNNPLYSATSFEQLGL